MSTYAFCSFPFPMLMVENKAFLRKDMLVPNIWNSNLFLASVSIKITETWEKYVITRSSKRIATIYAKAGPKGKVRINGCRQGIRELL